MTESPIPLTRRGVLRALTGGVLAAAAIAGCDNAQPPQATGNIVMIIRTGEKASGAGVGQSSLSDAGQARARGLADLFSPAQHLPKPGLDRPTAIYASAALDQRATLETVTPLAQRLRIQASTAVDGRQPDALVRRVSTQPGPTLICASSDEIPAIAQAFKPINTSPPHEWPITRFDVVWVLTQTTDGWVFSQVPELVLPGDQASTI